ncbi:lanC-like protein 3 [Tubulanus polymorphus]|uniref:lanC-like protein 3 n=1 Tax=Tubulanus polymorphus TaxID=672921 RepID=UPI003DA5940E
MRYFINKLLDSVPGAGSKIVIDKEYWMNIIESTVDRSILQGQPPTHKNCDGGLYVGCAGVAYSLYYLSRKSVLQRNKDRWLKQAEEYINVSLEFTRSKRNRDPTTSFLLGAGGVYAVGTLIYNQMGRTELANQLADNYAKLSHHVVPLNFLRCGSDELFVGRAGYLCGAFLLNNSFRPVVSTEAISSICASVIQSGREYAARIKFKHAPLMYAYYDTEYLGAAHGLSSILQMILNCPEFLTANPQALNDVHQTVDFMISLMQPNGNIAPAMDELRKPRPESEELIHWCHGAPGIVYLFAKAYLVWKDEKYLRACVKCGEVTWEKGLLKKGPGICHGVAGSGYVFLLLYRLTQDQKYIDRAVKFAEFMQSAEFQAARTPDCPYSLYEGLAGTVCFLADLLDPDAAEFPFFNVF